MNHGERLVMFGLWLWLTVVVGPWWLGVGLMLAGTIVNMVLHRRPR